jgi:ribosomal protein L11 methyltransferase
MSWLVYEFVSSDENEREFLMSLLAESGFDSFEETTSSVKAYVQNGVVTDIGVREVLYDHDLKDIQFQKYELENKNWNEEWEKNFQPVLIAGQVAIRAPFHEPMEAGYEIVIEPKMSFGTGHHETTALVIELMLAEEFKDKNVLDFGSGTGILSILASKLGAHSVLAIDNEEWAFNNCLENTERNSVVNVKAIFGDESFMFTELYDIVLANINRNVILANLKDWRKLMHKNGVMIVSGILIADETDILDEAKRNGLQSKQILRRNGWMAIAFH